MTYLKKFLKDLSKTTGLEVSQFEDLKRQELEVIPSGSFSLDEAIGVGGLPRGRIIEFYGMEASGKTLLALLAIASAQKQGLNTAFIDAEQSFDPKWANKLGVDQKKVVFAQPEYGEQAFNVVEELIKSDQFSLIVIDSLAALISKDEMESSTEQKHMGAQARMIGNELKRLVPLAGKHNTTVIFINQIRQKIGIMYGNPETTPGGLAMKFYASVRVRMSKVSGSDIKENGRVVGHTVKAVVKKNKVAPPYGEATFSINYTKGVDRVAELFEMAVAKGIIDRPNNVTYTFEDQSWRGKDATITALREDDKLLEKVKNTVIKKDKLEEKENGKK